MTKIAPASPVSQGPRRRTESLDRARGSKPDGGRPPWSDGERPQPMHADLRGQRSVAPPAEDGEQGGGALVVAQCVTLAGRPEQSSGEGAVRPNVGESGGTPVIEGQQICTGPVPAE